MPGLYNRDYSQLTEEEQVRQNEIDQASFITGSPFRRNCYHEYPKAIRHYLSLFPNNFMDIVDLQDSGELNQQCDSFETLLNGSITELDIKRFIQSNHYYHIPASILKYYPFGHHGAYVFKEFSLGTSYVADYLLVGDSSDGHQFVFVEFENPYNNIILTGGDFGATIRNGINQINDWKGFIESNFQTITTEFRRYTSKTLPDEFYRFDSTRMNYVVVAGRRSDFSDKARLLRRRLESENKIKLLHYDNLLDISRRTIGEATY